MTSPWRDHLPKNGDFFGAPNLNFNLWEITKIKESDIFIVLNEVTKFQVTWKWFRLIYVLIRFIKMVNPFFFFFFFPQIMFPYPQGHVPCACSPFVHLITFYLPARPPLWASICSHSVFTKSLVVVRECQASPPWRCETENEVNCRYSGIV